MMIPTIARPLASAIAERFAPPSKDPRMSRFLLGVNYWPSRTAMSMWQRFDLGQLREDASHMRALGLDVVRFFLMWDAFAPERDGVDAGALRRFEAAMQTFADARLLAIPTLFCGHMSGVNWMPRWAVDESRPHGRFRTIAGGALSPYGIGDFYADAALLDAQVRLARAAGERVRDHPALFAWDLGNEFSNLRTPSTADDAARWSARLSEALLDASGAPSTAGTHGEDVEYDRTLRPSSLARPWPFATMHGYSAFATFSRGPMDASVVPYYCALIQAFSGKPVFFTEFGNPACPPGESNIDGTACLDEAQMAQYARAVLDRLVQQGAIGALWWCWSDYDPALASVPPFDQAPRELRFGLLRADGSEKPVARVLSDIAREGRQVQPAPPPIAREDEFYASLPTGVDATYRAYCRLNG